MAKNASAGITVTQGHQRPDPSAPGPQNAVRRGSEKRRRAGLVRVVRGDALAGAAPVAPNFLRSFLQQAAPFAAIHALSVMERADIVEHGVPARFLERLATTLAMSKDKLYDIIGVARATADRKLKADDVLSAADSEHAMGLARLVGQVEQMVGESGDPDGFDAGRWVAAFLDAPSPALGGRRPRDLMRTSDGRTVVSTLVAQMQSGAYA